jgi:hypothetical protein
MALQETTVETDAVALSGNWTFSAGYDDGISPRPVIYWYIPICAETETNEDNTTFEWRILEPCSRVQEGRYSISLNKGNSSVITLLEAVSGLVQTDNELEYPIAKIIVIGIDLKFILMTALDQAFSPYICTWPLADTVGDVALGLPQDQVKNKGCGVSKCPMGAVQATIWIPKKDIREKK